VGKKLLAEVELEDVPFKVDAQSVGFKPTE
jgi:hypothetical protein